MKIGIYGGSIRRGAPLTSLVDEIVALEARGFKSYWTPHTGSFDALTMLALAGQRTSTIELGTAVVPTYPRHPATLAQQAATTNALCGGRLVLGVGPSHKPGIEGGYGLKYDRPALHMREYVTIVKKLSTEGRVDFQGKMYQVRNGFMVPDGKPFAVVMSALAPLMLKAAGEVADGTVTWMVGPQTIAESTSPRIRRAAADAGRPEPRIVVGVPVCVHDNRDEAIARSVQIFAGYSRLPNYRRQLDAEGIKEAGEIAVVGNEKEVEQQLRRYLDGGATEIIASVFPAGESGGASFERTYTLLRSLVA